MDGGILSQEQVKLNVVVTYGQVKAEFGGSPEAVLIAINSFLKENIPELNLAKLISVNYPTYELINMYRDVIKITPEGPRVWSGEYKFSDKDIVALQLIAARIGFETGNLDRSSLTLSEIQSSTGLKSKSISSRLSEITKPGLVEKETSEQGVKYKITTQGIYWLNNIISKKISHFSTPRKQAQSR